MAEWVDLEVAGAVSDSLRDALSSLPPLTMPPDVVSRIARALELERARTSGTVIDLRADDQHVDALVASEYRSAPARRRNSA